MKTPGIHHVTSIVGDPQENIDFYANLLGLRPLKLTVNFDLPQTYHLYYGDQAGQPGTILTTFPWPQARPGRRGTGQVGVTGFLVPEGSLRFWADYLRDKGVEVRGPSERFGEQVLTFTDPHGLVNELVARSGVGPGAAWIDGPILAEHAIVGFSGVTLHSARPSETAAILTDLLGFDPVGEEAGVRRFAGEPGALGSAVDLVTRPAATSGTEGVGTVHHVAWRTRDDEEQQAWRGRLHAAGVAVTPVRDRSYFRSIYFREPGGILFEIATDPPGFAIDEMPEELGTHLMLPPWYESRRAEIERGLQPVRLPSGAMVP